MSDIIQWSIVAIALIAATIVLTRKLRKSATSKCDGCCEGCKLHANTDDCTDSSKFGRNL